jgi:hypothetical protein
MHEVIASETDGHPSLGARVGALGLVAPRLRSAFAQAPPSRPEDGGLTISIARARTTDSRWSPPGTVTGAPRSDAELMKALVYNGPGDKSWTDASDPQIQNPTDIIVRIDTTTICGTDLHILKGDVPAVEPGRILGHEGVGEITEVGSSVTQLAPGDNVIISCIKSCGQCSFCRQGNFAHCL